MDDWRKFAQVNELDFDVDDLRGPSITGKYNNYNLSLDMVGQEDGEVFTHIELTRDKTIPPEVIPNAWDRFFVWRDIVSTGQFFVNDQGDRIYWQKPDITTDLSNSNVFDVLNQLMNLYPSLVDMGGEIVSQLEVNYLNSSVWKNFTQSLLRDISQVTTAKFADNLEQTLCLKCLTKCERHKVRLSALNTISYYGCRTCQQSMRLVQVTKGFYAILDHTQTDEILRQDNEIVQINWFIRQSMFDFDGVDIVQATDEDVERFVIQMGNDTDIARRLTYRTMTCTISPDCDLSENTMRILERTFESVEVNHAPNSTVAVHRQIPGDLESSPTDGERHSGDVGVSGSG